MTSSTWRFHYGPFTFIFLYQKFNLCFQFIGVNSVFLQITQIRCTQDDNLTHWGWDKLATIFLTISSYVFSSTKMFEFCLKFSLKFIPTGSINTSPTLAQIMAWSRPGIKPLSEAIIASHICVSQPQWVKRFIQQMHLHLEKSIIGWKQINKRWMLKTIILCALPTVLRINEQSNINWTCTTEVTHCWIVHLI